MSSPAKIRILLIDDDEDDFIIFKDVINDISRLDYQIDWSFQNEEVGHLICTKDYDICFIDYLLGSVNGLDLMKSCLECKPDLPFVFLTGKGNRDISIDALNAGASDYLVKSDLNAEKLERCIRYCIEKSIVLKKFRSSELRYRNIFEQSVDAIFLSNEKFEFITVNHSLEELTGLQMEELQHLNLYQFMTDDDDIQYLKKQIIEVDLLKEYEMMLRSVSGNSVHVLFSFRKIQDPISGIYIQGVFHDITHLKKIERSLIISEKMSAAGRLILALAHEIRNPLTNIQLSSHQLKSQMLNEDQQIMADIIDRNSNKVESILKELLFSSKKPHGQFRKYNVVEGLKDVIKESKDLFYLHSVAIETIFHSETLFISADPELLKIAFNNLILNAVDAMNNEHGIIEFVVKDDGGSVFISISDNGRGMSPDKLKKIFEPYYTDKVNGVGLGLFATLNIINVHQGGLEVDSEVGKGTSFTIKFKKLEEFNI